MTDDDNGFEHDPTSRSGLKYAISNLIHQFGTLDNISLAIIINVFFFSVGVVLFYILSGWLSFVAGVWAILNILPVIQWVLQV